jgi:hypothetical protein
VSISYNNRITNPFYHIAWGVRFFLAGARALVRHPDLLGLSLVPILLTVVLLVALAVAGAWIAGRLLVNVVGADLRVFAQALVFLLALMIGYFLYLPVARVLLAPFAEALSRKTRLINTSEAVRQQNLGWARAMWEGLKLVAFQSVVAAAALALSLFFPPVGAPGRRRRRGFSLRPGFPGHPAFDARVAIASQAGRDLAQ